MPLKQNFGPTVLTKGVSVYLTQVGTRTEIRLKAYFHYFQEKIQKKQTWEQHIALFSKKGHQTEEWPQCSVCQKWFCQRALLCFSYYRVLLFNSFSGENICSEIFFMRLFLQTFTLCQNCRREKHWRITKTCLFRSFYSTILCLSKICELDVTDHSCVHMYKGFHRRGWRYLFLKL